MVIVLGPQLAASFSGTGSGDKEGEERRDEYWVEVKKRIEVESDVRLELLGSLLVGTQSCGTDFNSRSVFVIARWIYLGGFESAEGRSP